jgi:hypothetical protein
VRFGRISDRPLARRRRKYNGRDAVCHGAAAATLWRHR